MSKHIMTDEEIDAECIALSKKSALDQLKNGTASSQLITYFLKLGSERERAEIKVLNAKTSNLEQGTDIIKIVKNADNAFRGYRGDIDEDSQEC